ncbi:protoglobin domain-containing protein [Neobacillus ginsengisoli]|uniref:Truncated hemoglobin YjbI n=1 Tax=Neobacillus ginsengisoli TaxID=904295 RepID=A0ABT9XXE6_9BACI|nr:protoglobin domain-containing protein [Neobacillus ginsengisoli]MDQ0200245.1 truncated hemoglobin YjbI [Neobacillus ginsengisoli]
MSITLGQEKVDELVERFYEKLLKNSYYISMFEQRNVDIELLKSRQRTFIYRLVTEDSSQDQENHVSKVKERHSFQMAPERAEIWMSTMKETMDEMTLDDTIKENLVGKIEFLMTKLI